MWTNGALTLQVTLSRKHDQPINENNCFAVSGSAGASMCREDSREGSVLSLEARGLSEIQRLDWAEIMTETTALNQNTFPVCQMETFRTQHNAG